MKVVDDAVTIQDNGGARSGQDRRQNKMAFQGDDKRSGDERRQKIDEAA